jgi:hypothetical protein
MRRNTLNLTVDAVALGAFVLLAASGALIRFVLPPGSGHSSTLWGWNRHDWGQAHFWIAVGLLATLGLHLFLHWRWIVHVVRGRSPEKSGIRVAVATVAVLAVVVFALTPFLGRVERTSDARPGCGTAQPSDSDSPRIDGSMTLVEIEARTGVPAEEILRELGLPSDLPADERLGRLRRAYGFEMHDVRDVVRRHAEQG